MVETQTITVTQTVTKNVDETILVIYAHPEGDGHCATILRELEFTLKEKNANYELLDLYKMCFDPVLKSSELTRAPPDPKIVELQTKVKNSSLLIFIYPVWWNSMPAILKGFFDRVFAAGFAFKYMPVIPSGMMPFFEKLFTLFKRRFDYGMPVGLLKGKKAIVFLTTGAPKYAGWPWHKFRFKTLIQHDILGFFGIKSKIVQFDNCRKLNDWETADIKKKVKRTLKNIK